MSSRADTIEALRTSYTSFAQVMGELTPEQWEAQSLCPEWDMRGVLFHAAVIEEGLLGWRPGDGNPFAAMGRIGDELAPLGNQALLERFVTVTADRLVELEAMGDEEFAADSITPVGPATYGRFMEIRVFDLWVHERDVRVPLGLPGDDSGPAAEIALDEVHASMGYIVGKKIGLADGSSIVFELSGGTPRTIAVAVEGRAKVVDAVAAPTVTVRMDSLTFVLLACGRIDPEGPLADGRIEIDGDPELGRHAASHLAFTM